MRVVACCALTCMLLFAALFRDTLPAYASPFDGVPDPPAATAQTSTVAAHNNRPNALVVFMNTMQRSASRELTKATASLGGNTFSPSFAFALALAFLYGCVHALGPGHGKSVVAGYVLSRDHALIRGVRLSISMAVTHVFSAFVIVAITALVLHQALSSLEDERMIRLVSYGAVILLGLILCSRAYRSNTDTPSCCADSHAHHDAACAHGNRVDRVNTIVALVSGAIPCTGSLLVLTYTVANKLYLSGVLLVVAIGIGMALTTSLFGIIVAYTRKGIISAGNRRSGVSIAAGRALAFAGPLLVVFTGSTLFTTTLLLT